MEAVSHKSPTSIVVMAVVVLLVIAAVTPTLIALSHALIPAIVVIGIFAVIVRLAFFHTRNW